MFRWLNTIERLGTAVLGMLHVKHAKHIMRKYSLVRLLFV